MKEALQYTFLSFFSYQKASESKKRSFLPSFLCFAMAIICFLLCFYFGYRLSFPTYYQRSADYQTFLYSAFTGENALQLKGDGKKFYSSKSGDVQSELTISREDKSYDKNGYELVIDTRDSKTNYNDFTLSYSKGKGEEKKTISYEEYLALDSAVQVTYTLEVTYSDHSLELTEEKMNSYLNYLSSSKDENVLSQMKALLVDNKVPKENYNAFYELYCATYYPSFSQIEKYGKVPMMRTYYLNNYLGRDEKGNMRHNKFLVILDDSLFTYFLDNHGNSHNISGYLKDHPFSLLNHGQNEKEEKENVDSFIRLAFSSNQNIAFFNYFVYTMRMALLLIIGWLALSIIFSIIGTIYKDKYLRNYFRMLNLSALFFLFSGVSCSLLAFIFSFFLPSGIIYYFSIVYILLTIFIRTILQIIHVHHENQKEDMKPQGE